MATQNVSGMDATWNLTDLEIRTKSVEQTLEPLVMQVTTLVNQKGPSRLKKGKSKKAHLLCEAVHQATQNFIAKGEDIANENAEVRNEMMAAVDDVRQAGDNMHIASSEFADDPCSSVMRSSMVRAARALLSAVTRLLILADMVDVYLLLKSLRAVEEDVHRLHQASSQQEVIDSFRSLGRRVVELADRTGRRQMDLKDPRRRDDLASARAVLKKNSLMLLTTCKTYVKHPELAAAKSNRDYVMGEVSDAVHTIGEVSQATGPSIHHPYEGIGELAAALEDFDSKVIMEPSSYNASRTRPCLEERLESIISGAALMADSSCTRDERREHIVKQCNSVRQALQDLLTQYEHNVGEQEPTESLDKAIENMCKKTRDLRKQLRKAVVDHVSDSFLETNVPLLILIEAAKAGNEGEVEEYGQVFMEHAGKLVEVANLACSMSSNEEGVKLVRLAAVQLETLCPQVVNAARVLACRPKSKVAQENMDVFKDSWERHVKILTEAVDEITTIDDFLAVSEEHVLEDVNKCIASLNDTDSDVLDRTAGAIRGRCSRVCNVVSAEIENCPPGVYADKVMDSIDLLREQVMPNFVNHVEDAVSLLLAGRQNDIDYNDFVYSAQLVYDGVRDVRRAVLMNRFQETNHSADNLVTFLAESHKPEDLGSDVEAEENVFDTVNPAGYRDEPDSSQLTRLDKNSQYYTDSEQYDGYSERSASGYDQYNSERQMPGSYPPDEQLPNQLPVQDASDYLYLQYKHQYDIEDVQMTQENYVDAMLPPEDLIEGKTARAWMRELPDAEKVAIQEQIAVFREEKRKLDIEIAKWDSRGNDIIMLAKQMCMIMMEMTDFTRGRGPLKTTNDVINAAKGISQIGTNLNDLCQKIADDCPDSRSKTDLAAYLGRIVLCCHQLNITSKVKADIQNVEGELIVSGLDSATSLIQAAKNLMNAVVYAVKASYVASTKYKCRQRAGVHWRMKPPPKKALVKREDPEDESARVRKGAQTKGLEPIKALSEFDSY
ncbi:catenin alpha-2-like [Watersipora subatra]|uniref:catenin alpha-2-like n=1 Tax=Watersipora subatra TaxID=2589382 RepID=UPI00355C7C7B